MSIYILCLIVFIFWLYIFFLKKNYLNIITFIFWGIFFPLFLYQLDWSYLVDNSNNSIFNYMFLTITIITIIYSCITANIKPFQLADNQTIEITSIGSNIAVFLNVSFILLYLLENYISSGSIVPGLIGIDIHNKASVSVISYITNISYLFLAFDLLAYKATKKKKYIIWLVVIVLTPIITRSARMTMLISLFQLLSLYILIFHRRNSSVTKKEKRHIIIRNTFITIIIIIFLLAIMSFTNYRMSHYGKYNITYADTIEWIGPTFLKWLAPYYGYFPLSFNNLKINIINQTIHPNYLGIYSFIGLYFGLFHIDRLLGIDGNLYNENNLITNGAANVPTGFWNFYYDYGILFFIPYIVALIILSIFLFNTRNSKYGLACTVLYCWYAASFFFMSFQNTLFTSVSIIDGILIYIIIMYSFRVKQTNNK
ncbi:oligosaccharide repeat unit polymerase [uncultured Limosilactobacillus sp.]|uniref:oligosaccharide repeat unit polymerase n=1 Tax=uncultured Limosilactobacillus sp. TaxID=2837629 RepID=UPI002596126B|nr:oligosaccharide repeat unit polymerase [uncultured Limosilactobacillus sp.]